MLPVAAKTWGPLAYHTAIRKDDPYGIFSELDILSRGTFAPYDLAFVAAFVLSLVCGLFRVAPRTMSVVNFILYYILSAKAHAMADGGDRLIGQLLFYLMVSSLATVADPRCHPIRTTIRNLAFLSTRVQICIVYAAAALVKLGGECWPRGEAMYYVLQTDEYTTPIIRYAIGTQGLTLALATYGVLLFQLSFTYLIWRDPTRKTMMLVGTFLHLQISFVLGLVSFGFAMIVGYSAFYTDAEASEILARWKRGFEELKADVLRSVSRLRAKRGGPLSLR